MNIHPQITKCEMGFFVFGRSWGWSDGGVDEEHLTAVQEMSYDVPLTRGGVTETLKWRLGYEGNTERGESRRPKCRPHVFPRGKVPH